MRRERLTRRFHSATEVVGWISNNDMLLLGLGFALVVALCYASQLLNTRRANGELRDDVNALHGKLNIVELRDAESSAEKSRLLRENGRLAAEADQAPPLRSRVDGLVKNVSDLETQRDQLLGENRRLDDVAVQLASLRTEYDKLTMSLANTAKQQSRADAENASLKSRLAVAETSLAKTTRLLSDATSATNAVQSRLAAATAERNAARQESRAFHSHIDAEAGLHKELIGLKGNLGRVAIVFDTSASMAEGGRWDKARGVVATWLKHLAIGECALVLFSTDVHVYPADGSYLKMRGPEGMDNRRRLLDRIAATHPSGGTNTLKAMEMAYRFANLDTIILFTDGEPNRPGTRVAGSKFDPEVAERIYALCGEHKQIPVNAVGLGNYFKPQLSGFLMRVAEETGGSFLGR